VSALSYSEWRAQWDAMRDDERQLVRDKAQYEHMSLWAVLNDWPSLRLSDATLSERGARAS